jgi:hypothetical protein
MENLEMFLIFRRKIKSEQYPELIGRNDNSVQHEKARHSPGLLVGTYS